MGQPVGFSTTKFWLNHRSPNPILLFNLLLPTLLRRFVFGRLAFQFRLDQVGILQYTEFFSIFGSLSFSQICVSPVICDVASFVEGYKNMRQMCRLPTPAAVMLCVAGLRPLLESADR